MVAVLLTWGCLRAVIIAAWDDVLRMRLHTVEMLLQLLQIEAHVPVLACGGIQSICHLVETRMLCLCCFFAETSETLLRLWNQPACKYSLESVLLSNCYLECVVDTLKKRFS